MLSRVDLISRVGPDIKKKMDNIIDECNCNSKMIIVGSILLGFLASVGTTLVVLTIVYA